jgi:hypothetical protein
LVEQRTENPRVGGSIPSLATLKSGFSDGLKPDHKFDYKEGRVSGLSPLSFWYPPPV